MHLDAVDVGAAGTVTTLANPRLLALNNEPSIVRTGAISFSVTPQISGDSLLTLSLTPMLQAPLAIESDMLARIVDGETLVVDVANFSPKSGFQGAHEHLHLVERWTRLDAATLRHAEVRAAQSRAERR